jgi:hypothetical protein
MEKRNIIAEIVEVPKFVFMIDTNGIAKIVVGQHYVKLLYVKQTQIQNIEVIVLLVLFTCFQTNQMYETTRLKKNASSTISPSPSPNSHGSPTKKSKTDAPVVAQTYY